MAGPAAHDFMVDEVLSASVLNNSVVDRISYYAGQELGSDDASEIEAALRILDGSGGRFLGVPGGTTGQRPTGAAGRFRRNTTTGVLEYHDGSGWVSLLEGNAVTYQALNANGDVGNGAAQVPRGTHVHSYSLGTYLIRAATQHLLSGGGALNIAAFPNGLEAGTYVVFLAFGVIDGDEGRVFTVVDADNVSTVLATTGAYDQNEGMVQASFTIAATTNVQLWVTPSNAGTNINNLSVMILSYATA